MELKHTPKAPKAAKDSLHAYFVSVHNIKQTTQALKDHYGLEMRLKNDVSEKGAVHLHYTEALKVALIGIGNRENDPEDHRRAMGTAISRANEHKLKKVFAAYMPPAHENANELLTAQAEAAALANYQFLVYKTEKKENTVAQVSLLGSGAAAKAAVAKGAKLAEATAISRDLVNEPVITLTAPEMAKRIQKLGKRFGFKVEVFNKAKIQSLKMGGLLAVNYGSPLPPTFSILEWKPKKAKNKQPIVLVGKGVVYDTGGLSLKPTAGSMDLMKCDMAGAAAVIGALCGVASLDLPYHVVGLVPATDNRPGQNAYTPGDVITMYDGTTVEVLNTDAEGRLLLADALGYAKKYKPGLVIDLATLTGAAVIALGYQGSMMCSTADESVKADMKAAGERTYERVVEFPVWEEYHEQLKSDIADLRNIGGKPAGSITAAKFLQHFTDYPWIHLDIAGPAFLPAADSYRSKNGTGRRCAAAG